MSCNESTSNSAGDGGAGSGCGPHRSQRSQRRKSRLQLSAPVVPRTEAWVAADASDDDQHHQHSTDSDSDMDDRNGASPTVVSESCAGSSNPGFMGYIHREQRNVVAVKRSHLECCVCYDSLQKTKIYVCLQCANGILCEGCKGRVAFCPTCRHKEVARCMYLERLLSDESCAMCSFEGCTEFGSFLALQDHAKYCTYRPVNCLYCERAVPSRDMPAHWLETHKVTPVDKIDIAALDRSPDLALSTYMFILENRFRAHVKYLCVEPHPYVERHKFRVTCTDKYNCMVPNDRVRVRVVGTFKVCQPDLEEVGGFTNRTDVWMKAGTVYEYGQQFWNAFLSSKGYHPNTVGEISMRIVDIKLVE